MEFEMRTLGRGFYRDEIEYKWQGRKFYTEISRM